MDAKNFQKWLVQHHACSVAVTWLREHDYGLAAAWEACERADWMLELAACAGVDLRLIVRVGCACARTALPFVPADEPAPRIAIETAERWTRGEATREEVRAAAYAAYDAAHAADRAALAAALREMAALVRQIIPAATLAAAAQQTM